MCATRKTVKCPKKNSHISIIYRDFKNFNETNFLNDLANEPFDKIKNETICNVAIDKWYKLFNKILNVHAPLKTKRVKQQFKPKWLTLEINKARHLRDKFHKIRKWEQYKHWRNKVVLLINKEKKNYYKKAIEKNQTTGQVWKYLNELNSKKQLSPPSNIQYENTKTTSSNEIADLFNKYFTELPDKLLKNIPVVNHKIDTQHSKKIMSKSPQFKISTISETEVYKTLVGLNVNKAAGIDSIGPRILKLSAPVITESVTHVINLSVKTNQFPECFKCAKVTPIFKNGAKDDPCNYRPISILPTISKIFEKHVAKLLYSYLNNNSLLHKEQSGFRKSHSCQTALVKITDMWLKEMNDGNLTGVVFLDFKKAFDLVDHTILISKLKLFNFHTHAIEWIISYLNNRTQHVCIGSSKSSLAMVKTGVPQGSVLGPLLFLLFINDLPLTVKNSHIDLFADDTTLHISGSSLETIQIKLNEDIRRIVEWCINNNMLLNENKTKCMLFTTAQKLSHMEQKYLNLYVKDTKVECVTTHKLLGINTDHFLLWNAQVDNICKSLTSKIALLLKIRKFLPLKIRILYFNAYIQPLINYCLTIWGNCSKQDLHRISKLLKRAARIILDKPHDAPSKPLFKELKWLTIDKYVEYQKAILVYKSLNGIAPQCLQEMFNKTQTVYGLRSTENGYLSVPKPNIEHFKKSFQFSGVNIWNSLPFNVKDSKSLNIFKKNCFKYFFLIK